MKSSKLKGAVLVAVYTSVFCLTSGIVYGMCCSQNKPAESTNSGFSSCGLDPAFGQPGWIEANRDFLKQHPNKVRNLSMILRQIHIEFSE
jgi:hypothetical protein